MKHLIVLLMTFVLQETAVGFAPASVKRATGWSVSATWSDSRLKATWSDNRATLEYQAFLSSGKQEIEKEEDGPSVIVMPISGSTTLAQGLASLGQGDDMILTPGEDLPSSLGGSDSFPIYVTLPPTELADFLKTMPDSIKARREDLVFFSGGLEYGNIEGVLKDYGYARDTTTQVLLSGIKFTSPTLIEDISVQLGAAANGEEKWAGECAACGKWAGAIERRLERNAIRCKSSFYREWKRLMWEQSIVDAVFHLVGAVRSEPTTVADVALYYDNEVSDMVWEISSVLRGSRALTLTYGFEERMFGAAEAQGVDQPCVLKDDMYPFLYQPFEMAKMFMEYLSYAQDECGLLPNISLLRKSSTLMDKPPVFRQGNMRADGVV